MRSPYALSQDVTKPNRERVLVVEDEEDISLMLETALRESGYDVQTAASVEAAKECLFRAPVDLLMVDWHLPDGNGDEVCVAAREVNPALPIVSLSAIQTGSVRHAWDCRPDVTLIKPVDLHVLRVIIRQLLEEAPVQ